MSSIHSKVRKGDRPSRPSATAAINEHTRMPQNLTAGPICGPFAHNVSRFGGIVMTVETFALSTGRRTSSTCTRTPRSRLIFQTIATV